MADYQHITASPIVSKYLEPGKPIRATVKRLDTVLLNITLKDEDSNPCNLTGCTVYISATDSDKTVLYDAEIVIEESGTLRCVVQPDVVGRYSLEARVTSGNNDETTFFLGTMVVAWEDEDTGVAPAISSMTQVLRDMRTEVNAAIVSAEDMSMEVGTVSTGEAGSSASVVNSGTNRNVVLDFAIPRGDSVELRIDSGYIQWKGTVDEVWNNLHAVSAITPTITVGTVTTGNAGTNVTVTNSGTGKDGIFNFTIPRGDDVELRIDNGYLQWKNTTASTWNNIYAITDITATIEVGTVTTGDADSSVTFTNVGSGKDAIFNLSIPKGTTFTPSVSAEGIISFTNDGGITNPSSVNITGPQGPQGEVGPQGIQGPQGLQGIKGVSMRHMGAWASGASYVNDTAYIDIVTLNGSSYACKLSHTSTEANIPPNETNWELLSEKGDWGTMTVGTVTNGAAGSNVVITNVGTDTDAVLDIAIPIGSTFTPSVSAEGVLSWTNDGGLDNPVDVSLFPTGALERQVMVSDGLGGITWQYIGDMAIKGGI